MKPYPNSAQFKAIVLLTLCSWLGACAGGGGGGGESDASMAGKWLIQWESNKQGSANLPACQVTAVPRQETVTINITGTNRDAPIVVDFEDGRTWQGRITNADGTALIVGRAIPLNCPDEPNANLREDFDSFVVWASDPSAGVMSDVRAVRWTKCGPNECHSLSQGFGERIQ